MREDYYPNENCYPRSEYYPVGYREDEEMWVYDQCCANCARSQARHVLGPVLETPPSIWKP